MTAILVQEAEELFAQGKYTSAIRKYEEAQESAGEPSWVIQSWMGLSYRALRDYDRAIYYFTKAIEIRDNSSDRLNRATTYLYSHQCREALEDASIALSMEPGVNVGFHSDAEAHLVMGQCYVESHQYVLALEHIDAAVQIAKEHNVRPERLEELELFRVDVETIVLGNAYPEDILLGYALKDFNHGLAYFHEERFQEAAAVFESARQEHGKPSGLILNMLARSYDLMGYPEVAVQYFSESIELRDDSYNRTWRALTFFYHDDCENAMADSYAVLTRQPHVEPGFHTTVEVRAIMGSCLAAAGQFGGAMDNLAEAMSLAEENAYLPEEIAYLSDLYEDCKEGAASQDTATP